MTNEAEVFIEASVPNTGKEFQDTASERMVQSALDTLSQGRTTLVIAHRLSTIRKAHKIVVIDAGRVVEQGDHDQLMAQGGAYARLIALQFGEE